MFPGAVIGAGLLRTPLRARRVPTYSPSLGASFSHAVLRLLYSAGSPTCGLHASVFARSTLHRGKSGVKPVSCYCERPYPKLGEGKGTRMDFFDSPQASVIIGALGVIIGSIVAGAFTLLAQILSNWRQKKQFAHDLEVRQKQFAHERDQENRGRRTTALADLQLLLEDQKTALQDLWGSIINPDTHPYLTFSPEDAWKVLKEKNYRIKVWPVNLPLSKAIIEYAVQTDKLLLFLRQQEQSGKLAARRTNALDETLRAEVDLNFRAAATPLSTAIAETGRLMSELNGIPIRRAT